MNDPTTEGNEVQEAQIAIMTQTRFRATQVPVKNKSKILEDELEEASRDLQENVRGLAQMRNEYTTMEHNITVGLNNLLEEQLEEIRKAGIKLRRIEETNETERTAVNKQIGVLTKLKNKIQADMFALNSRVEASEVDVGFE
eukprot:TRINITY_DN8580_c0_g2_i4.p1 TRINITY_DN8580_c0_g2~~TRINITY_DN8580_c0_g2_i4.p1  ORF type:complete len:142 (+),score=46.59 TRINITY_DN8580_c0_g2_i4:140-565(+)